MPVRNKQISTATSGTVTCNDTGEDQTLFLDAGLIAILTIAMPLNPRDGQRVTIKAKTGVTLLTVSAPTGTIQFPITSLGTAQWTFTWNELDQKWY